MSDEIKPIVKVLDKISKESSIVKPDYMSQEDWDDLPLYLQYLNRKRIINLETNLKT